MATDERDTEQNAQSEVLSSDVAGTGEKYLKALFCMQIKETESVAPFTQMDLKIK